MFPWMILFKSFFRDEFANDDDDSNQVEWPDCVILSPESSGICIASSDKTGHSYNQGGRNSSIGTPGSTNDQILPNGESIIAVQAQCGVGESLFYCKQWILNYHSMVNHLKRAFLFSRLAEYKCAYCGKQYVSRGRTRRHITDCHETSTVPCPNCGKVFTSTRRLKDHQRSRYCHGVSHQLPQVWEL